MSKSKQRRNSRTSTVVLQHEHVPSNTKDYQSKSTKWTTIWVAAIGAAATITAAVIGVFATSNTNQVRPTGSATVSSPASIPASTSMPTRSADSPLIVGDSSLFIKDVTYPDRSEVAAGQHFIKKWEIRNTGTARWADRYLAPIGESTGSCTVPSRVSVPTTNPGQSVVISVSVTAASTPQLCYVTWKMVTGNNVQYFPDLMGIWFEVRVIAGRHGLYSCQHPESGNLPQDHSSTRCRTTETRIVRRAIDTNDEAN